MPIDIKQLQVPNAGFTLGTHKKERKEISLGEILNKDIQLFGSSFSAKKKEALYAELNILLTAGLDVQKSLLLIENGQTKKQDKKVIGQIRETIVNGAVLSEAFRQTGYFSDYEIFSIQIGEETGRLNTILEELSIFYAKSVKFRQQLIGALSYPLFVTGFAFLVVFFLLKYLVPLFSDVYKRFGGNLPVLTQKIIYLSDWLSHYSGLMFLSFGLVIVALFSQRKKIWFRRSSSILILRMPIFGKIIKKIFLARFCQSMSLLLSAKVPLMRAIELVQKMIGFYAIESTLYVVEKDILNGSLLQSALEKHSFYPPQLIALIQVGEEAGNLNMMFTKLAQQYNQDVDEQTKIIGTLIEPILIVVLGFIVGVILVAMYLPLFQMSSGIK
jgi:type IV pilus assembly protein PilC